MAGLPSMGQRHFDGLVFGDEPAAIMTALELKRQLVRLKHLNHPQVVLVADPDTRAALGGVLSRSGLACIPRAGHWERGVCELFWGGR